MKTATLVVLFAAMSINCSSLAQDCSKIVSSKDSKQAQVESSQLERAKAISTKTSSQLIESLMVAKAVMREMTPGQASVIRKLSITATLQAKRYGEFENGEQLDRLAVQSTAAELGWMDSEVAEELDQLAEMLFLEKKYDEAMNCYQVSQLIHEHNFEQSEESRRALYPGTAPDESSLLKRSRLIAKSGRDEERARCLFALSRFSEAAVCEKDTIDELTQATALDDKVQAADQYVPCGLLLAKINLTLMQFLAGQEKVALDSVKSLEKQTSFSKIPLALKCSDPALVTQNQMLFAFCSGDLKSAASLATQILNGKRDDKIGTVYAHAWLLKAILSQMNKQSDQFESELLSAKKLFDDYYKNTFYEKQIDRAIDIVIKQNATTGKIDVDTLLSSLNPEESLEYGTCVRKGLKVGAHKLR